jgi:small subunit ribosomal protein S27e
MKSEPTSKFLKVRCPKCKNEQIIFEKATSKVECLVCQNVLAQPHGGKAKLTVQPLEVLQ